MNQPRDFDIGVARQLAQSDKQIGRINSYAVGPGVSDFYADYLGLIGMRGLWFPGSADNTGAVYDRSGQARTLTYNGNPLLTLAAIPTPPVLLPYYALDGTGDFFSRADEAGLRATGGETYIGVAQRGVTVGGWFYSSTLTGNEGLISKYTAAGNLKSWALLLAGNQADFTVSNSGADNFSALSTSLLPNTWYFIVGRYDPSVEVAVLVNDVKVSNVTTIPATLAVGAAALQIGAYDAGTNLLTGGLGLAFYCAARLPDYFLTYLFNRGRVHFGI